MPFSMDKNGKSDLILPGNSNFRVSVDLNTELIFTTINRDFSADTVNWTLADGWARSAGNGNWQHTAARVGITELTSAFMTAKSIRKGYRYSITFTVSGWSAGTLTPALGNVVGIAVGAGGTYNQIIQAAYDDVSLIFIPTSTFVGAIDDVSIKCIKDLINTDSNGNTISTSDNVGISTYMGNDPEDLGLRYPIMPAHGTWQYNFTYGWFRVYDANIGGWYPTNELDSTVAFQSEAAASLTKGLLCCFNLDDDAASTAVTDSTGRITGTASVNTDVLSDAGGKLGGCFKFDATTHVHLSGLESVYGQYINWNKPFSISLWINPDVVNGARQLFSTLAATGFNLTTYLATVYYDWMSAAQYQGGTPTSILAIGVWSHIVFTYNGASNFKALSGNVKIYHNTTKLAMIEYINGAQSTAVCGEYSLALATGGGTLGYDGFMDQVLIWNREITAAEVALLYNAGAGLAF